MLKKLVATIAVAIGVGVAGLTVGSSTADARIWFPRHHFEHHFHGGPFFGGGIFIGPPVVYDDYYYTGGGCRWLRIQALRTGSPYWYRRWRACVGY